VVASAAGAAKEIFALGADNEAARHITTVKDELGHQGLDPCQIVGITLLKVRFSLWLCLFADGAPHPLGSHWTCRPLSFRFTPTPLQ
jgi:hypothetical protein